VALGDARGVGRVSEPVLRTLRQLARVEAYVPLAQDAGLPAVEALGIGLALVASNTVPSVLDNECAESVDPRSVDAIAEALVRAVGAHRDDATREARRESVARADLARLRSRSLAGVVVRVALDVPAVPARPAGAGRYAIALAQELAQRDDLDLTVAGSRRRDGDRWSTGSKPAEVAPIACPELRRAARVAYEELWLGRSQVARSVDVWHGSMHYESRSVGRPGQVVTIHDLTFFTHPEWHEALKVSLQRAIVAQFSAPTPWSPVSESNQHRAERALHFTCPVLHSPRCRPRSLHAGGAREFSSALHLVRGHARTPQGGPRPVASVRTDRRETRAGHRSGTRGTTRLGHGGVREPAHAPFRLAH
jgi:hypothetical protein